MDMEAGKSSFITFLLISLVTQKGPTKIGHSFPACPSAIGALWRGAHNCLHRYPKIFSHGTVMLCLSLSGLAASFVVLTTLLIAPIYSLQLLAYVCFAVATIPHLLEV